MEAFERVRVFVNKTLVSKEAGRRGNPGYPRLQAVLLLVYARLKGIRTDKGLICLLTISLKAVINDEPSIRKTSQYCN